MKTITGIIHGKTIELTELSGLSEGEIVEVVVRAVSPSQSTSAALHRCAGALADSRTDDDDRILQQIQRDREQATYRASPE